MSKLTVTCDAWRPLRKGSLLGFAKIRIGEMDLVVHDVALHISHGKLWAALPSKPWIKDNALVLGDDGRPKYSPMLEFSRPEVRAAFSQRVVEAVGHYDPEALNDAEDAA